MNGSRLGHMYVLQLNLVIIGEKGTTCIVKSNGNKGKDLLNK